MRRYLRSLTKLENIKDAHPENVDITDGLTKVQKMIFQLALKDDGRSVTMKCPSVKTAVNGAKYVPFQFSPDAGGIEDAV